jgi:hypothetical protein
MNATTTTGLVLTVGSLPLPTPLPACERVMEPQRLKTKTETPKGHHLNTGDGPFFWRKERCHDTEREETSADGFTSDDGVLEEDGYGYGV